MVGRVEATGRKPTRLAKRMLKQYQLYIMLLAPVVIMVLFYWGPMYGAQIAFKNYSISKGILGSPWVGFKYFERFFSSPQLPSLLINTLRISALTILLGFPVPMLMALALNATRNTRFRRVMQTGYYIPYFISVVVVIGMLRQMTNMKFGVVNMAIGLLGGEAVNFMGSPEWFPWLYVLTDIWQSAGYTSIIYLAALTSIDPQLYDASCVDGASRLQQIWHIELPGMIPSACILLILRTGDIINVGFEKVYLMQNPLNLSASEVLSTYVYKIGVASASMLPNYSYGTAIGLFNSVVSLVMVVIVNHVVKKMGGNSLW